MSFDLNIENYTREELIEMFELPSNFDRNIVEIKESKLRDNITNNNQINKDTKLKTINFLIKAKNIILNENKQLNLSSFEKKLEDANVYHTNYKLKPTKLESTDGHMLQNPDNSPYISSFPSEFFNGVINPLKKRTTKKNINIDTRFRDNYYSSSSTNFILFLPTNFDNIVQMQLSSIELPSSYYVVSKQYGNNFFTIIVDDGTSKYDTIINIPDGNYTQTTIMNVINNILTSKGAPFSYVSFMVNLTDGTTGSCQTMVAPNGTGPVVTIELNFQADRNGIYDNNTPLPLKLGWNLGFRNGVYVGNSNYVSEGLVDLTGPRYFFLVVDDYNNNLNDGFFSAFNSSILNKNILARISNQSTHFNTLEQNNLNIITSPREYFGPVNINNLQIQLLDEYGRIVDLNNMDFSFCLTLITAYDL